MSSGTRLHRQVRIDHQNERRVRQQRQRRKIDQRLVGQALIERDIDRHGRRRRHQERVAVRRGLLHRDRGDDGAGAGLVLDQKGFAEPLLELAGDHARQQIGAAARRKRIDDGDRPGRIILTDSFGKAGGGQDKDRGGEGDRSGEPHDVLLPRPLFGSFP
jgi:hypothetical protein